MLVEDETQELVKAYYFKNKECEYFKNKASDYSALLTVQQNNIEQLRRQNNELRGELVSELEGLKNVIKILIEVNKETIEKMQNNNEKPSDFIFAETETFEKVIRIIEKRKESYDVIEDGFRL